MTPTMKRLAMLALLLGLATSLTACGRKGSKMEVPEGDDPHAYPRSFPAAQTDPRGTYFPPAAAQAGVPAAPLLPPPAPKQP